MMSLNKAWTALKSAVGAAPTVVAASTAAVEQVPYHPHRKDTVLYLVSSLSSPT